MKTKNPTWLIVSFIAVYFYGISIGEGLEWYYQFIFFLAFAISLHMSND